MSSVEKGFGGTIGVVLALVFVGAVFFIGVPLMCCGGCISIGAVGSGGVAASSSASRSTSSRPTEARRPAVPSADARRYLEAWRAANGDPHISVRSMSVGDLGPLRGKRDHSFFEIIQIVDDETAMIRCDDVQFFLVGVNMRSFADGAGVELNDQICQVAGTQRYKTVLGATKQLYVVKPLKFDEANEQWLTAEQVRINQEYFAQYAAGQAEAAAAEKPPAAEEPPADDATAEDLPESDSIDEPAESEPPPAERRDPSLREWTSADGKFKVSAHFLEVKAGKARLAKPRAGGVIEVPLARLSALDQQWIRDEAKRRRDAKPD